MLVCPSLLSTCDYCCACLKFFLRSLGTWTMLRARGGSTEHPDIITMFV